MAIIIYKSKVSIFCYRRVETSRLKLFNPIQRIQFKDSRQIWRNCVVIFQGLRCRNILHQMCPSEAVDLAAKVSGRVITRIKEERETNCTLQG